MMSLINRQNFGAPTLWWADLVLFKACWVALVVFQANGVIPAVLMIGLKLLLWPSTRHMLCVMFMVLAMGLVLDQTLVFLGIFRFEEPLLPLWLVLLWLAFALTVPRAFVPVGRLHPMLQSACGMLAGVCGYLAGYFTSAVSFGYSLPVTVLVIAICWALLVPLIFFANRKLPEQ